MRSFTACFHQRRLQRRLVFYADGEMTPHESAAMRRHLESCAICRQKLADIRACRELLQAARTPEFVPTEQLWQRLVRKISVSSPKRFDLGEVFFPLNWRYLQWSLVTAGLLLLSVIVWKKMSLGERTVLTETKAAIDYGIFLDDIRHQAAEAKFYKRYPAQVVKLAEARQEIAFPLAAIEALPDSFRLDCVRVLECNGKKCIQFTCSKAGKVIHIFQHALGQPWTLGRYAVARTPICNVNCLMVNAKNLTALSWQGSRSEYLAVGDLAPQEFAQVVQILR